MRPQEESLEEFNRTWYWRRRERQAAALYNHHVCRQHARHNLGEWADEVPAGDYKHLKSDLKAHVGRMTREDFIVTELHADGEGAIANAKDEL